MPKRLMNQAENVIKEAFEGLLLLSSGMVMRHKDLEIAIRREIEVDKVRILVGGGSGHDPLFSGFVGRGMADASVNGNFFAAPTPNLVLEAIQALDNGKGVLLLYGNYAGDNLNFDMAAELAEDNGIRTMTVRVADDVATEDSEGRRGIAGDVLVIKIAGAASRKVESLEELHRITTMAAENTFSIGVAVKPGSNPETGQNTFELSDDEIEIGMGLHGEPGVSRQKIIPMDALVEAMLVRILDASGVKSGDTVVVLVNNLGSSTYTELLIANRALQILLRERGIGVHDTQLGTFCTTQEMGGFSISLLRLNAELERFYNAEAQSLALRMGDAQSGALV